jgi:protein gp37
MNRWRGTGFAYTPEALRRGWIELYLDEKVLAAPLGWRKPRRVFVCSMTDLFADFVSGEWIDRVFAVMALTPRHTYQVLTKRPERMRGHLTPQPPLQGERGSARSAGERVWREADRIACAHRLGEGHPSAEYLYDGPKHARWPLPNVIVMVSVEDQATADARIPALLDTPAALRGISLEPMIGAVDLNHIQIEKQCLDWVICGGESGPDARPMHPDWVRAVRDQCVAAGVAFFFKQWGRWFPRSEWEHNPELVLPDDCDAYTDSPHTRVLEGLDGLEPMHDVGKKAAGRMLDGRVWDEQPGLQAEWN